MSLKKYNVKENYNHAGTRKIPFYKMDEAELVEALTPKSTQGACAGSSRVYPESSTTKTPTGGRRTGRRHVRRWQRSSVRLLTRDGISIISWQGPLQIITPLSSAKTWR